MIFGDNGEMRVGKRQICGGDTKEEVVEVQEMIAGETYIIKGVEPRFVFSVARGCIRWTR
ncbi:MAG: hypothetical protein AEth_00366 [Candidatus Argoarchaeum ethanivorans]|uniref:Uncharacterized protein n=1 Tax=Candidatus Argoarchaeum ethanivorans TaxID=2608793 RepID=A0A8B3S712_9EURY|nr:MAG: hypothetical protein AEth_00366 [Candidatus Argoarchaeum ethanivorans]